MESASAAPAVTYSATQYWPKPGAKYGKSAAQVVIRWHIQRGIIVLPKSTHAERIKQNFEVFDFNLSVDDMTAISAINTGKRNGADPDNFNF